MHTLFNLNPFLRSDGFWIISDLTNTPNLFYHAFNKIKDLFKIARGKKVKKWTRVDYLLFIYGLFSMSFIGLFLYFVLIKNPDSIIYFPKNLLYFFTEIFYNDSKTSLIKLGKLVVPVLFFMMIFNLSKSLIKKGYSRFNQKKKI